MCASVPAACLVLAAFAGVAPASPLTNGRIGVFAGSGSDTGSTSGDGGPALYAELNEPRGLASDAAGNLYIAEEARVRRVDAYGLISTFAGRSYGDDAGDGGPARNATLTPPRWLAAAGGNLYVLGWTESSFHNWVRVISGRMIHRFAGTATWGFSGDGGPAVNAQLDHPHGLAADSAGNVYVADTGRIRRVAANGIISTIAGTGTPGFSGDGGPATAAQIDYTLSLATDSAGNLYHGGVNRIRRIAANGVITTIAGTGSSGSTGDGGPATRARIGRVGAMVVDKEGTLFFADSEHHRVRAITPAGTIVTAAGNGTESGFPSTGLARKASVVAPAGLALDGRGHLLISSYGRNQVLRYTPGLTAAAAGRCSRNAAREIFERRGIGNAGFTDHPELQVFCGRFAGRRSRTMVASVSIPSCGASTGWYVFRSVNGRWKRILKVNHGALLTRSGRTIHEWQGVLSPRDAHCFPSSARVRHWRWNGRKLVPSAWQRRAKLPRRLPGMLRVL
jgi:sugar lactone lactonase YvrE